MDAKQKWQEATHEILSKLDIATEYKALNLDVTGHKPSAKGWLEARSFGVEDRTPSAGINVANGAYLGRYKDFRSGETLSLFDFAAQKAGKFGGDWREARRHYARVAGVELPNGEDEIVADRFAFSELTAGVKLIYATGKPGVTWQAISDVGGRQAYWPKKLPAEKTNNLIAFPMYGSALLELEPVGWHCVAQNPKFKIRQFQGPGREEKRLDKMTAGEYGLMNVDTLKRLATVDVLNVVEGISDLLAGQGVLGPWRAADPENRKHGIVSSGACTYHPRPEWMQHFAGKEVRLWFDVGDAKDEGQVAAAVWAAALLPVAKCVRNVQLPLGPEGGKNDLRAWLVGDESRGLPSHNYADMCECAETFPAIKPTDAGAGLSPGDAILKNLGITVIGEHDGRQWIEVFSESRRKASTIHDIDRLSIPKLIQLVGGDAVEQYVYEGTECPPDKYSLKDVKKAIAHSASDKIFYGDEKFGAGIWEHDGQLVLVKANEIGILNGGGRIELSHIPCVGSRILDCGRASGDWYDLATVNRHLESARDHGWCNATIMEAFDVFKRWHWRQATEAPLMVTGLLICSWLQSIWQWRPQVFVTGNSNTGKTMLLDDTISKGIFGSLAMFVEKPTEAAISQAMKHHSKIILIDEFEKDTHRQKILELFRTTSRGGVKIRGTADHKGISFRLKHLPWLSSIETGLTREADKNRYIVFDLDVITPEKRTEFLASTPSTAYLNDLGMRLLAIGLAHYQEARRLTQLMQFREIDGVPSRCLESFSLPCAMLAAAFGFDDDRATKLLDEILLAWDFGFQKSNDHVDCLSTILTATVDVGRGEKKNVSALLKEPGPDAKSALERVGVRLIKKRDAKRRIELCGERYCWWIEPEVASRTILKGSRYEGHAVEQYLMRFAGAKRTRQRLGGDELFDGIEIPQTAVSSHFHESDDHEQQTSQDGSKGEAA